MIRVHLAGAADIAALLAAHAPPRPDRASGHEADWAEQARPVPHRVGGMGVGRVGAGRADDGSGRVHPAPGVVR